MPGTAGGDHALKIGYRWRSAHSVSLNHFGGNAVARFTNGAPNSVDIYRDGNSVSHLDTHALYIQDTFTRNRFTLNLGLRWDRQDDKALAATVPASPMALQTLPAVNFPGADAGVAWNDISPRLGMTYDLTGDGRTVLQASYSMYYGQMSPGQLSGELAAVGAVMVRYPWTDSNTDGFVQTNEVNYSTILARSSTYDPNNPTNFNSPGKVDGDIKNDRTREFIVGFDRQLGRNMAVGGSYIWRKYDNFQWRDVNGFTSADWRAVTFNPTGCPAGARCETVTYFEPTFAIPSPYLYTNVPDRWRDYNGFEVQLQKRYSNNWSANLSYAYNDAVDTFDSPASYEDPTCRSTLCPGQQAYAVESAGSGLDNVFNNAKWLIKTGGRYTTPLWAIDIAGYYSIRQGYPFPQGILTPNRANQGGQTTVLLERMGEVRLDTFQTADLRIGRDVTMGRMRLSPSLDIFNIANVNTVQGRRRNQAAANANQISTIMAPRIVRFGVRVQW
jgi:hypothetical protein